MNFYALSALINGLASSALGIFVYFKNRKGVVNRYYGLTTIFISIWSYCYFLWQISTQEIQALFWCRALMIGAIFIPPTYLHFVLTLLSLHRDKRKILIFNYILSFIFFILNFTPLFVKGVTPKLFFRYWPDAGIAYLPFLLLVYFNCVAYAISVMFKGFKKEIGIKRVQIKYVLMGAILGFGGGATNFPLWYNISIPPVGNILVSVGIGIMAYAVVRYRLMDINVALTRAGIFAFVYLFVLGIPFGLAGWGRPWLIGIFGEGWFWLPMFILLGFASAGPFIYLFLQRRAEDVILKEQRRYQNTLRQLSSTLTLIKDLDRLLKLIVLRVARAVKVDFACIYLSDENKKAFLQKFPYTIKGFFPEFPSEISFGSELISQIKEKHKPLFSEELTESIKREFKLRGGLIIPSFVRGRLLGFLLLGPKSTGAIYTQDDANMFEILANQVGLSIENTEFITEFQRTQAQLFSAKRMSDLGTMAGGMSHQINNRFHVILLAAGDSLDTLKFIDTNSFSQETKEYFEQIKYALTRIEENAKHGGKIVNDFLNFSQPERIKRETKEFDLREPLKGAIEMVKIKRSFPEEMIERLIPENSFKIKGDFVQMQDVNFNILDNALDATKSKESAIKEKRLPEPEEGYTPKITIKIFKEDLWINLKISDNGIGMTEDVKEKIFAPFFTTKATSVKGTGLGLFVIKRIIEAHGGTIEVESEYGRGTAFTIKLPIVEEKYA